MKKLLQKFMLLFVIIMTLVVAPNVQANVQANGSSNNALTLENFEAMKEQGYIGDDVTYEDLKRINDESLEMEKVLAQSSQFSIVPFAVGTLQAGDIIITNATSSFGLTGHAAIVLNTGRILHIAGPNQEVSKMQQSDFVDAYNSGWIKVYRPNNASNGLIASYWANNTYYGSGATYAITMDLTTTNKTYCSKLVWQAYYYGVGSAVAPNVNLKSYVLPYFLIGDLSHGTLSFPYYFELY